MRAPGNAGRSHYIPTLLAYGCQLLSRSPGTKIHIHYVVENLKNINGFNSYLITINFGMLLRGI